MVTNQNHIKINCSISPFTSIDKTFRWCYFNYFFFPFLFFCCCCFFLYFKLFGTNENEECIGTIKSVNKKVNRYKMIIKGNTWAHFYIKQNLRNNNNNKKIITHSKEFSFLFENSISIIFLCNTGIGNNPFKIKTLGDFVFEIISRFSKGGNRSNVFFAKGQTASSK